MEEDTPFTQGSSSGNHVLLPWHHGRGSDAEYFNNAYKKFFSSLFLVFRSLPFDFDIGPTDIEENVRPKPPFEDGAICFPRCWSISHAGLLLLLPGGVDHQ